MLEIEMKFPVSDFASIEAHAQVSPVAVFIDTLLILAPACALTPSTDGDVETR